MGFISSEDVICPGFGCFSYYTGHYLSGYVELTCQFYFLIVWHIGKWIYIMTRVAVATFLHKTVFFFLPDLETSVFVIVWMECFPSWAKFTGPSSYSVAYDYLLHDR